MVFSVKLSRGIIPRAGSPRPYMSQEMRKPCLLAWDWKPMDVPLFQIPCKPTGLMSMHNQVSVTSSDGKYAQ